MKKAVTDAFRARLGAYKHHKKEFGENVVAAVRRIENAYAFKRNLRQLVVVARITRDHTQHYREQVYKRMLTQIFMRCQVSEQGPIRSSRADLLYDTIVLRRYHYQAYPDLYPNGFPHIPMPAARPQPVYRGTTTWQEDLFMDGYPNILKIPPSRSPIPSTTVWSSSRTPRTFLEQYLKQQRKGRKGPGFIVITPERPDPRKPRNPFTVRISSAEKELIAKREDAIRDVSNTLFRPPKPSVFKTLRCIRAYRDSPEARSEIAALIPAPMRAADEQQDGGQTTKKMRKRKNRKADEVIMAQIEGVLVAAEGEADVDGTRAARMVTRSKRQRRG